MTYLVTGCSRGVGLEICRVLLKQGHSVYGISRSYSEAFANLKREFEGTLFFKSVDLNDSENVQENIFKGFLNNRVQLHGYVNNAAVAYDDIITNLNLTKLQSMYAVNVFTPMMITKYVLRNMLLHHTKGSIVHISSISVHTLPSSKLISVTAEQDKNALEPTVSVRLSIVTTPLFAGGQKMSVVKSLLYNIPLAEA